MHDVTSCPFCGCFCIAWRTWTFATGAYRGTPFRVHLACIEPFLERLRRTA